jgi:hypothetical protein
MGEVQANCQKGGNPLFVAAFLLWISLVESRAFFVPIEQLIEHFSDTNFSFSTYANPRLFLTKGDSHVIQNS